ncbi:MAG: arginase [Chitinophagales bacterium]|nr:arginase [Chitinophagales bacterium]
MKKVKIIEIKSEIGAGTRGSSLGVDAIKIAALDYRSQFFKQYPRVEIANENHLLLEPDENPYAKRIKGVVAMYDRISSEVKQTMLAGEFPIFLSGDHSSAGGIIAGLKMAFPEENIGVIWIDAHADLHTPYTTPSGNLHGMPLAVSLGEDNLSQKINKPIPDTVENWEKLKNMGGIKPKIAGNDIVMIGLRDSEPQENYLIRKLKIKRFSVKQLKKVGVEKVTLEVMQQLRHCDKIFVSFDVDSLDSKISKGTGTPVRDGMSEREVKSLILNLLEEDKVCAFEIAEINPTLDKENLMAEIAFEILQMATNQLTAPI